MGPSHARVADERHIVIPPGARASHRPRSPGGFHRGDTSEVWDVGPDQSTVHLSYWLPSNTLEGETVPVIAVVSPYFSYGQPGDESTQTNVVSAGRGEFIYQNFVPHGYAFAQVSVFGTELSTGCFDYRGLGEGLGIHSAVEWLGSQEWSNGNVGLYGKSYEGATQWEAAAMGSEYLRTIVPVSGPTALHPLLYKNGSAEARSQIMHMNYFSTVDYNEDDLDNVCPDIAEGRLPDRSPTSPARWTHTCRTTTTTGATLTRRSRTGTARSTGSRACRTGTSTPTRCSAGPLA